MAGSTPPVVLGQCDPGLSKVLLRQWSEDVFSARGKNVRDTVGTPPPWVRCCFATPLSPGDPGEQRREQLQVADAPSGKTADHHIAKNIDRASKRRPST